MTKPAIVVATRGADFLGWRVVGVFDTLNQAQDHAMTIGKPGEFTVFIPVVTVKNRTDNDAKAD